MLARSGNEERAILALDETHQADEPELEGSIGRRRRHRASEIRTGGCCAAEYNSTDEIATIHFCSYFGGLSIGAVNHQRSPSAESTAVLLQCVALDSGEGFFCRDLCGQLAVEPYHQFAG